MAFCWWIGGVVRGQHSPISPLSSSLLRVFLFFSLSWNSGGKFRIPDASSKRYPFLVSSFSLYVIRGNQIFLFYPKSISEWLGSATSKRVFPNRTAPGVPRSGCRPHQRVPTETHNPDPIDVLTPLRTNKHCNLSSTNRYHVEGHLSTAFRHCRNTAQNALQLTILKLMQSLKHLIVATHCDSW